MREKRNAARMAPTAFAAWMRRMQYSRSEAARRLGVTHYSIRTWVKAHGRGAPQHIALACEALEWRTLHREEVQ